MSFWKGIIFSYSQKIGMIALALIMFLMMLGISIYREFESQSRPVDIQLTLPTIVEQIDSIETDSQSPLDINLADSTDWIALKGIGPVLSGRILRFRAAKGGFRSVDELKKVYGLKEEVFAELQPYLYVDPANIPSSSVSIERQARKNTRPIEPIEINQASPEEFQQLKGIGPVLGNRIVKFRNAKKGFNQIDELKQVYGLAPEVFEEIKPYLYIEEPIESDTTSAYLADNLETNKRRFSPEDTASSSEFGKSQGASEIPVLELNQADSAQLIQLPGIGKWTASQIIRYRNRIGFFISVDQLKEIPRLSDQNYDRMSPYLHVGNVSNFPKKELNRTSEWSLKVHRRVGEEVAKRIILRRKQLGRFASWQELRKIEGVDDTIIGYLRKYFNL